MHDLVFAFKENAGKQYRGCVGKAEIRGKEVNYKVVTDITEGIFRL